MNRRTLVAAAFACSAFLVVPTASAATLDDASFEALSPGEALTLSQDVPVRVVLVGYDPDEVSDAIEATLPDASDPVVRYPLFYGISGRDLGLHFDYDYEFVDAPRSFENGVFRRLADVAKVTKRTGVQTAYNQQKANNERVSSRILTIDALKAERILQRRATNGLGLQLDEGYTVFLVNWWGRDDFRFHVYRKTNEPDPDTGVNFGADYDSGAMIAWGGSSGRTWFYDLSAGPESWTSNWNVDDADVDGDEVPDYRMPPVWEYAVDGNRPRSELGSDLGLVVRFVAINLLFTTSPLYDPLATSPEPGGGKHVQVTMFEGDPTARGTDWINLPSSVSKWRRLQPAFDIDGRLADVDPINPGSQRTLDIFAGLSDQQGCWKPYGDPFAQMYCYYDARRDRWLPPDGPDYVQGVFAFNTTDENMGAQFGLLGFADDNWVDGTPTYVFEFDTPAYRDAGYGFTTTTTHEVGHSLGMSHPHDGYDSELGLDYGPSGDFYFAWSGDESNTVMQYLGVSNGFGVFDRDNMSRYLVAGYLNWSNELLGQLQGASLSKAQLATLAEADLLAKKALVAFDGWRYEDAASVAWAAYERVGSVAVQEGLDPKPAGVAAFRALAGADDVPRVDADPRFPER